MRGDVPGTPCSRRWFTGLPLCAGPYPCSSDCHVAQDRSFSQATATLRRTGLVLSRAPLYPGGAPSRWRLEKVSTRLTYIANGEARVGKVSTPRVPTLPHTQASDPLATLLWRMLVAQGNPCPYEKKSRSVDGLAGSSGEAPLSSDAQRSATGNDRRSFA